MARWKLKKKPPTSAAGPRDGSAALEFAEPEPPAIAMVDLDRAGTNQLLGLQAALEEMAHLQSVVQHETKQETKPPGPIAVPEPPPRPATVRASVQPGEVTEAAGTVRLIRITGEIEALIEESLEAESAEEAIEVAGVDASAAAPLPPAIASAFEILHPDCPPKWAEAFRKLRGRLLEERARWEAAGRRLGSIAVVSPRRCGGRSATARNLAACLGALPDSPVLLVDADVARPSLDRRLRISRTPGLTDAIATRGGNWGGHLHYLPGSGVHVLTLGQPAAGIDALDLARLPEFLTAASNAFPWVIIDAPPMDSADGELLAGITDGTVLVLRREREYFDEADAAVRRIDPAKLLGTVLNFS